MKEWNNGILEFWNTGKRIRGTKNGKNVAFEFF
jgi:hypothetical protein